MRHNRYDKYSNVNDDIDESENYAEEPFRNQYTLAGNPAIKREGYFKEYDFYIPSIRIQGRDPSVGMTCEVKYDKFYNKSSNIAIELISNNKLSGINTTESDWWLTKLTDGREYMAESWRLKRFIERCQEAFDYKNQPREIFSIIYNVGQNRAQTIATVKLEFLNKQNFWKEFDTDARPTRRNTPRDT